MPRKKKQTEQERKQELEQIRLEAQKDPVDAFVEDTCQKSFSHLLSTELRYSTGRRLKEYLDSLPDDRLDDLVIPHVFDASLIPVTNFIHSTELIPSYGKPSLPDQKKLREFLMESVRENCGEDVTAWRVQYDVEDKIIESKGYRKTLGGLYFKPRQENECQPDAKPESSRTDIPSTSTAIATDTSKESGEG